MKSCLKCEKTKSEQEFYKWRGICIKCYLDLKKQYNKKYYRKHSKSLIKKQNLYYVKNRESILQYKSQYYKTHRLKINKRDYIRKQFKKCTDIQFYLSITLRSRLNNIVRNKSKMGSAVRDLGCSLKFLKKYLEKKFKKGMNWKNRGKWHIDHIRPLSSFDLRKRKELLKACHYTNLQPLWATENRQKSNKYEKFNKPN